MIDVRSTLLAAALLAAGALPALAVGLSTPTDLPPQRQVPDPHPYDTTADAHAAVDAAFARAKRTGKLVLLDFGANWCPDCRLLSADLQMPQVRPWVDSHFEEARVNVDRFNVNMDIPRQYGVKVTQIPTVLILTADGRLLNADGSTSLGNARGMMPQAVVDLIGSWAQRAP